MRKMEARLIGFLGVVLFSVAVAFAGDLAVDEQQLREIVKEVIKENPKLIFDTVNNYVKEQQKKSQQQALEASFKNRINDVVADNNPTKGHKNAPITIIEYTDFQCPYCARGAKTIDRIVEMYPEKVRLAFKNNPLKFHAQALPAAKAALAANRQGKFWEYHDLLFKNSASLNEEKFLKFAQDLGLDMEKFNKDRNSEEIAKQIESEQASASKHKLTGTPSFVLNGVVIRGAQPPKNFVNVIDRLLEKDELANQ